MKYNKFLFLYLTIILSTFSVVLAGCSKEEDMAIPPQVPFFMQNSGKGDYTIATPTTTFKIPVGLTAASNSETTVNISVNSTTGATQGTHYTLNKTTLTFPAGVVTDTIVVTGAYNQYLSGRKDTLVFSITNDKGVTSTLKSSYTLAIAGPCFEGDVNLNSFLGAWTTNEVFGTSAWGPYQTTVTAVNQLTPTTGTISVRNLYDSGWNPVTFLLDWTDPANRTVTLATQTGIGNAGTVNSTYEGRDLQVRAFAGQVGTFSACNKTITLKMQVGVVGLGYFGSLYTVELTK